MLSWALMVSVVGMISAFFGFAGLTADLSTVVQVFFFAVLGLFVLAIIVGMARGRPPGRS